LRDSQCDVRAEVCAVERDAVEGQIGACAGLGEITATRDDRENSTAGRNESVAVAGSCRVSDGDTGNLERVSETEYLASTTVIATSLENTGSSAVARRPVAVARSRSASDESRRSSTTWVSGSPKRALNSMTRTPSFVTMSPQ
jgi:hypothetical protein